MARIALIQAIRVAIIVGGLLLGWMYWREVNRPTISINNVWIESDRLLCIGEALDYRFTLSVREKLTVDLYVTTTRYQSKTLVSYAKIQQTRFNGNTDIEIIRHWILPVKYIEPVSWKEMRLTPGLYAQKVRAVVKETGNRLTYLYSLL